MVKKTVKEKTKELFEEFLNEKGYGVYNDGFMNRHYNIRIPKPKENMSRYYVDDILDDNLYHIGTQDIFFEFLKKVLNKNEHDVALYQAIKKTPGNKHYDYEKITSSIINKLTPFKKTLFEYVVRPRFLEHNWSRIEDIFKTIDNQENRIAVIEAVMQTNTFKSLDTQKSIYNLVQKHIRNPEKFDSYFDKINKVQPHLSVVDYIDSPSVVIIAFTEEKLVGANLNTEIGSKSLVDGIRKVANNLKKEYKDDLKIINILMDYDTETKQHLLNIICPHSHVELNKLVFEEIINDISRLSTTDELREYQSESKTAFVKKCKSFQMHEELQDGLDIANDEVQKKKNKL
jgi:hypothetical protein